MKAWHYALWEFLGVTFAESRGKAKAAVVRAATDAGYEVSFTDLIHVWRAPRYDSLQPKPGTIWGVEYAERELASLSASTSTKGEG